jgi:hypothetical protein
MATSGESCKEPLAVIPHDDDAVICQGGQERTPPSLDAIPGGTQPVPRCGCGAPAWNYMENSPEEPPRYTKPQPLCRDHRLGLYSDYRAASAEGRQRFRQEQRERMAEAAYRRLKDAEAAGSAPRTADQDPEDGRQAGPAPLVAARPQVPKRGAVLARWIVTWQKVRPHYRRKTYIELSAWLGRMHPALRRCPDTLADICRAGAAGLLEVDEVRDE